MWSLPSLRSVAPPSQPPRPWSPPIREVIRVVAANRDIRPSERWIDELAAHCETLPELHAKLDYLEQEFGAYDLACIERTLEAKRHELRQLNNRRRQMLHAQPASYDAEGNRIEAAE